jgi:hypothetical protein
MLTVTLFQAWILALDQRLAYGAPIGPQYLPESIY